MDFLNQSNLKNIIEEINSDENKSRKADHQKRSHVFNDHQREYVMEMLVKEFSSKTVSEMRTCTSINLSRRIITEMSSVYKRTPDRVFSELSEEQEAAVKLIYDDSRANVKLKKANQKYKLHDQCAIQVIPKNGKISLKLLAPQQYDVIPDPQDPETAIAYIISALDKSSVDSASINSDIDGSNYGSKNIPKSNNKNEAIADRDDYKAALDRYVIWTKDANIVCNGNGQILEANDNPIGMIPFIDVSSEKDFEFWVRKGSGVVSFSLDFAVILSDTCNTNRLQSYSQGVIVAEKVPESVTVGPQHILFLPIDPTRPEIKPSFEFVSPQPDMKASLDLQDRLISYFLTSQGVDPKTITASGDANKYASGLERLLAMVERFEASQDDLDMFDAVEDELYILIRAWYGAIVGTPLLKDKYSFGVWPEESEVSVNFIGPELINTQSDKEDSVIKRIESGLISQVEGIMELRGVSEEKAQEILLKIDENNQPQLIDQTNKQGA